MKTKRSKPVVERKINRSPLGPKTKIWLGPRDDLDDVLDEEFGESCFVAPIGTKSSAQRVGTLVLPDGTERAVLQHIIGVDFAHGSDSTVVAEVQDGKVTRVQKVAP